MTLDFFMPMIPPTVTHQEKSVHVVRGKPVFYEPAELKDARAKLTAHLGQHRPERPLEGAVELLTLWYFPLTEQHKSGEPKITKPDTDNLQKLLKDCMTELGFWKDDAQVFNEKCVKFWGDTPGIFIFAGEYEGTERM